MPEIESQVPQKRLNKQRVAPQIQTHIDVDNPLITIDPQSAQSLPVYTAQPPMNLNFNPYNQIPRIAPTSNSYAQYLPSFPTFSMMPPVLNYTPYNPLNRPYMPSIPIANRQATFTTNYPQPHIPPRGDIVNPDYSFIPI